MALIQQQGGGLVTTESVREGGLMCHTCREKKPGLYTVDPYGKPMCADCARIAKRPID